VCIGNNNLRRQKTKIADRQQGEQYKDIFHLMKFLYAKEKIFFTKTIHRYAKRFLA